MPGRSLKEFALAATARIGRTLTGTSGTTPKLGAPDRILLFQAGGIGDILRIFPLLESLHAAFPGAALFTLSPFHTSVYALLREPGMLAGSLPYNPTNAQRGLAAKLKLARALRGYGFDLIVNPARGQGMLQHALLSFAIGAPVRVGFDDEGAGFANNVRVPLTADRPIVLQNLDLLRALGTEPQVTDVHLRVPRIDLASLLPRTLDESEPLIAIHAGSTWESRLQWQLARYAELLTALLREHRCTILLLGTAPETPMGDALMAQANQPRVVNLIGKTSLLQVAALLSRCALFIGNDSGLLHVALGLRTPAIGLFGYTAPQQVIFPQGPCVALHKPGRTRLYEHQAFFTFRDEGPNPLDNIHVSDVLDAARSLLRGELSSPSTGA